MTSWQKIKNWFRQPEVKYILFLFLGTRIVLTAATAWSRLFFLTKPLTYSKYLWLDIWGNWDSFWYLDIAEHGYSAALNSFGQANYAFFPLYPLLMKFAGFFAGGNHYFAGLLVSNLALVAGASYLYKLTRLECADDRTALDSVKFLFLFPSAFILSGVFSESLFLALSIASFYYAKKNSWRAASVAGALAALTRSVGVFMIIPLAWLYLKNKNFQLKEMKKDVLCLLLPPAAFFSFFFYLYRLTNDFFAYLKIQQSGFFHAFANPLKILYENFLSGNFVLVFNTAVTALIVLLFLFYRKKIDFSFWLLSLIYLAFPVLNGREFAFGAWRYILVIFPLYLLLANLIKNRLANLMISAGFFLFQLLLMIIWSNNLFYVLI